MFKLKITFEGNEIEIEVPMKETASLSHNKAELLEILFAACTQINELAKNNN